MFKKIFTTIMVCFFCASMATAADQIRQKDQKQDQKKDGSCKMIQMDDSQNQNMAALKQRIRKRDGSCQTGLTENVSDKLMAAD